MGEFNFPDTKEGHDDMVECLSWLYRYIIRENPSFASMSADRLDCYNKAFTILKKYFIETKDNG